MRTECLGFRFGGLKISKETIEGKDHFYIDIAYVDESLECPEGEKLSKRLVILSGQASTTIMGIPLVFLGSESLGKSTVYFLQHPQKSDLQLNVHVKTINMNIEDVNIGPKPRKLA